MSFFARRAVRMFWHRVKSALGYGAGFALVSAAGFALWESGSLARIGAETAGRMAAAAARHGFRVEEVTLTGRVRASADEVLARLGTQRGMPIFDLDLSAAQARLLDVSWIRAAEVSRRLPDTIAVRIAERAPMALWADARGRLSLIDVGGTVLAPARREEWGALPVVHGAGAPARAAELLRLLDAAPGIAAQVDFAIRVGDRRWDLRLKNGVLVLLPEADAGLALARLMQAEARHGLLGRDLKRVDLRLPDRLVVEPLAKS